MTLENDETDIIEVITDGGPIKIEVRAISGREKVAFKSLPFKQFRESLTSIAGEIRSALTKIGPSKTVVEFGVEASLDAGGLVAVLVRGSTKANLKVTLEWSTVEEKGSK